MVSKICPIIGEHIVIIFMTQYVTIATVCTPKNTLYYNLISKMAWWVFLKLSPFDKHDEMQLLA